MYHIWYPVQFLLTLLIFNNLTANQQSREIGVLKQESKRFDVNNYYISEWEEETTWADASLQCKRHFKGWGNLLSIETLEEYEFLRTNFHFVTGVNYWTSGALNENTGKLEWATETSLDWINQTHNWEPGTNSDNYLSNGKIVVVLRVQTRTNWFFKKIENYGQNFRFICEKDDLWPITAISRDVCRTSQDLQIVLDGSTSSDLTDFHDCLDFARKLGKRWINQRVVNRLGFTVYSRNASFVFNLKSFSKLLEVDTQIISATNLTRYPERNMDCGLDFANFDLGARKKQHIQQNVLIISSGVPENRISALDGANRLRKLGVRLFVIQVDSIGNYDFRHFLKDVVGGSWDRIFKIQSSEDIGQLVDPVMDKLCDW